MSTKIISVGGPGKKGWPGIGSGTPIPPHDHFRLVSQTTALVTVHVTNTQKTGIGGMTTATKTLDMPAGSIIGMGNKDLLKKVGTNSIFIGDASGNLTTTTTGNLGFGDNTLSNITTGSGNIAIGQASLNNTTTGRGNIAIGQQAMQGNITGLLNIALGQSSLTTLTSGGACVAIGYQSLTLTTGGNNVGLGNNSGNKLTTGSQNIFLGSGAGGQAAQKVDASNNVVIGYNASGTANNQVILGNTSITETCFSGSLLCQTGGVTKGCILPEAGSVFTMTGENGIQTRIMSQNSDVLLRADTGNVYLYAITGNIEMDSQGTGNHAKISSNEIIFQANSGNVKVNLKTNSSMAFYNTTVPGIVGNIFVDNTLAGKGFRIEGADGVETKLESMNESVIIRANSIGDISISTDSGSMDLDTGNGEINMTTYSGSINLTTGTGGYGDITISSYASGGLTTLEGKGIDITSHSDAINISAVLGGITITGGVGNQVRMTARNDSIVLESDTGGGDAYLVANNGDVMIGAKGGTHRIELGDSVGAAVYRIVLRSDKVHCPILNTYTDNATAVTGLGGTGYLYIDGLIPGNVKITY